MPTYEAPPPAEGDGAYRQIFHALDTGLVRANLEGYILEANARFATLLGLSPAAMVGLHVADITPPDDVATTLAQMNAALAGERQPFVLNRLQTLADGRQAWVRIQVMLLRDDDDRPLQFVGIAQEGLPSSDALPSSAPHNERRPGPGFDVIAGMSHALRTPLNAILGFAQLLRVDPSQRLSPGQSEKIAHIEQAGAQLLDLLSDVIDLARLEAQSLPLQIQLLPLAPMLEEALAGAAAAAEQAGVSLLSRLPEEALCIWADRDRLRQVLLKLLHHALREPRSGGRVLLEAQALHHQVALTVSDTLHDLSGAQQAALFTLPAAGRDPGTGDGTHLGLHIVQRLVELMQGRIEVSSAAGGGTRLRVWLPQGQTLQPLPEEAFTPTKSAFGELEGMVGEHPLTVLYAEDNVVNIELVRQVMRMRPQWRLEVAYSGQDAIAMALRDPPDLLLLDMHLGDMSGLDVSNVLTRQPYTADIPRVALSADVLPDLVREARAQGFVDYLTKPLDVGRLLRLLDRVSQLKAE
ncbi:MAG: hypothetical protein A3G29_11690 [Burkholderiales bacterium RIFCSPLOWO2_12_FULL_64_99]|nr:MAG: hypothetical protein A3E52_06025 [Burkholderiales bacterium RIFCSPHIGHO2_12_FULL_63_20]OGB61573.1 MAG: hypothetical protein A3G29_11690 [Burkholderiales bacterium RIFCSPLOWO2_12_FULL_64_99]